MPSNPHNYLTKKTNTDKSKQLSFKEYQYRQIHTTILQRVPIKTNPHNYLTKNTNAVKSTQLSDEENKYRQIQTTLWQRKQARTYAELSGKENESGYIHKTNWKREQYIPTNPQSYPTKNICRSHVTAIRAMVWPSGKFERVTLLVPYRRPWPICTFWQILPHRRQAITLPCTHYATTHKTESLRVTAWCLVPLITIKRNSVPISAGVTTKMTQIFVDPLRNLKYPVLPRAFTSDRLPFDAV